MQAMNQTRATIFGNAPYATPEPVPEQQSEIDRETHRIAVELGYVEHAVDEMARRLASLMCEPPSEKASATPREICGSLFGQQLQTQAERAHNAAARIDYLMSCLRI
jgi:hypothetical protein